MNYYVCNGAVIGAEFGDDKADSEATAILARLYPGREVVSLNVDPLGEAGAASTARPNNNRHERHSRLLPEQRRVRRPEDHLPESVEMSLILKDLLPLCVEAIAAVDRHETAAREAVRKLVAPKGKVDPALLEREQFAAHGFAWIATYVAALRQMLRWAESGHDGELERLILQSAFGEYLAQLKGGIAISQVEIVRPGDLGLDGAALETPAVAKLIAANTPAVRGRIAELIADGLETGGFGALGLDDEALEEVRRQFRRFVDTEVGPHAHGWHLRDELIPMPVVQKMAELGVFGLTVPEEWGGLGMGKLAMCVVTEELSRRLYRRRLAGHAFGDRRGADPFRRHRRAEEEVSLAHRLGRAAANGRLHRAQYRLRSCEPAHACRARGRHLQDQRQQDLDHARRSCGHHDVAGAQRCLKPELPGPLDVPCREASRQRRRSIPGQGHERWRDPRAGLSRHEGIRDRLRRLRSAGGQSAGREGRPRLQAAHGDLRKRAHPDSGTCCRRGAERTGAGAALCARARPVRQAALCLPARRRQGRLDGGRDDDRPPAHLLRRAREGLRSALAISRPAWPSC